MDLGLQHQFLPDVPFPCARIDLQICMPQIAYVIVWPAELTEQRAQEVCIWGCFSFAA